MKFVSRMPATLVALLIASVLVSVAVLGNINIVQLDLEILESLESHEKDGVTVAIFLVIGGVLIDQFIAHRRYRRRLEIEAERLRVLKATMRTVQDIVNNCLNNLLLLRFEVDGKFSGDSLRLFDSAVDEIAQKLKLLGDLESTPEKLMASGIGIDYLKATKGEPPPSKVSSGEPPQKADEKRSRAA